MIVNLRTALNNGIPLLPPMNAQDNYCLHFTDPITGEIRGGYSLLEEPDSDNRIRVQLEVSPVVYAAMLTDPSLNLTDVEIVPDEQVDP
jgi:hypothetical protein